MWENVSVAVRLAVTVGDGVILRESVAAAVAVPVSERLPLRVKLCWFVCVSVLEMNSDTVADAVVDLLCA